jgi:hypothetical protein
MEADTGTDMRKPSTPQGPGAEFESALRSEDAVTALREVCAGLLKDGWSREQLLEELEQYRRGLDGTEGSEDENALLDVMDFVTGWTSPRLAL